MRGLERQRTSFCNLQNATLEFSSKQFLIDAKVPTSLQDQSPTGQPEVTEIDNNSPGMGTDRAQSKTV